MKEAKSTLDYTRFHNDGPLMGSFLARYFDLNCKRMVSPYTSSNKAPFACKKCYQFYCYDCIKNQKTSINICLRCKGKLVTVSVTGTGLNELLGFQVYCKNRDFGCEKSYRLKDEQTHMQFCKYNKDEAYDSDSSEDSLSDPLEDVKTGLAISQSKRFTARIYWEPIKKVNEYVCTNDHPLQILGYNVYISSHVSCVNCREEKYVGYLPDGLTCRECRQYVCPKCTKLYNMDTEVVVTCLKEHPLVKQVVNIEGKTFVECYECSEKFSTIQGNCFMYSCLKCQQFMCEKCQKQLLKEKETPLGEVKTVSNCFNPLVLNQEQMLNAINCDKGHPLQKNFKIDGKVQDYRCNKCLKRHLSSADGVLRCGSCQHNVCPSCEERLLAAKTKETTDVACKTCKNTSKQVKKFQRVLKCPSNRHILGKFTESKQLRCSLNCPFKSTTTILGCECFGICQLCCNYVTETNNVENPDFLKFNCVKGGHQLHDWQMYSASSDCQLCLKDLSYNADTICCQNCDFNVCSDCKKGYSTGPILEIVCCNSYKMNRKLTETYVSEYYCSFCQKILPRSIPYYLTQNCSGRSFCDPCVKNYMIKHLPQGTGVTDFFFNQYLKCEAKHQLVKYPNIEEFRTSIARDEPEKKFRCFLCKNPKPTEQWFYRCNKEKCNYDLCMTCAEKIKVENNDTFKALKNQVEEKLKNEPTLYYELPKDEKKSVVEQFVEKCDRSESAITYYEENKQACNFHLNKLMPGQIAIAAKGNANKDGQPDTVVNRPEEVPQTNEDAAVDPNSGEPQNVANSSQVANGNEEEQKADTADNVGPLQHVPSEDSDDSHDDDKEDNDFIFQGKNPFPSNNIWK
jgi:hypothetical protein